MLMSVLGQAATQLVFHMVPNARSLLSALCTMVHGKYLSVVACPNARTQIYKTYLSKRMRIMRMFSNHVLVLETNAR